VANIYFKVAAILLLPLIVAGSLYFGYFNGSPTKFSGRNGSFSVYAPLGSRIAFNLPDGTKGWLNSGSTLTYPLPFDENRNVALEGEAWFDVFHDEKRPFEVKAGESLIRVLGTSFNVSAYREEKYVEVVLQSGKVEFSNESQTEKVILQPSEQLILHENRLEISSVDVSKYKAWTEGRLVFRGDYMAEVAKKIERWYNIKVEIADKDLTQFSFRATFVDDALEDVLNQLSMTSPIEYKILPGKQLQDGTYEKEKVILYKNN
jgi:ferric-dicitrate binding protein FerR (iron transport regulator)